MDIVRLWIYHNSNVQIDSISDSAGTLLSCVRTEEINGEDSLRFESTELYEKGYYALLKDSFGIWHEYRIIDIDTTHEWSVNNVYFAVNSIDELSAKVILDKRPNTLQDAIVAICEGTRWTPGAITQDSSGHENFYRIDAFKALQQTLKTFGGEIQTRIDVTDEKVRARYLDVRAARGDYHGQRFTYSHNLTSVKRTVESDQVITRLYAFGKGKKAEEGETDTRGIDFSSVNNGKMYIENTEATEQFGIVNQDGVKLPLEGTVEFEDDEDPSILLKHAKEYLDIVSKPKISYEVGIDLLNETKLSLGDQIDIIDTEITPELRLTGRAVKIEHDDLDQTNTKVTIGAIVDSLSSSFRNVSKSVQDVLKTVKSAQNQIDEMSLAYDANGKIKASYIDDLLAAISSEFKSGGTWITASRQKGLQALNAVDENKATQCVQITGDGIRVANSKNSLGEFNYRSAITGAGITADVINAGTINGRNGHWNLETGDITLNNLRGNSAYLNNSSVSGTLYAGNLTVSSGKVRGPQGGYIDFGAWGYGVTSNLGHGGYGVRIVAPNVYLSGHLYSSLGDSYGANNGFTGSVWVINGATEIGRSENGNFVTRNGFDYTALRFENGLLLNPYNDSRHEGV
ncbi:MAG: phage tail spike protein [Coriobacteriia bacterium]|nr:phage tail spike protein [Coriobacteriia bacterium]